MGYNYYKKSIIRLIKTDQKNYYQVTDQKITDNTKPFKIDVTYPYVENFEEFNKAVRDFVDKEVSSFKENVLANDAAMKEFDPEGYAKDPRIYDLIITYSKGLSDPNTISTVMDIYNFTGGAHGASYSVAINFDPKTKKEIKLADLFPGQADYLKKVSDFCIADLTKQMNKKAEGFDWDKSWLNTGAGPVEQNYKTFLINKENIIIYFDPYAVGPWSFGDFKVIMPR